MLAFLLLLKRHWDNWQNLSISYLDRGNSREYRMALFSKRGYKGGGERGKEEKRKREKNEKGREEDGEGEREKEREN